MNSSKSKIKKPNQGKKIQKVVNSKIWVIAISIMSVILIGALLFDQLYKRVIITIDEDKYNIEDLSYYFYEIESQYDYYDQMFGGQYWDMAYDETSGTTMRDVAQQEAIQSSLYNEIMFREATSKGYSLTAEENETIATKVTTLQNDELTSAQIKHNGFTKKYLTKIINKETLANRYRQDIVDSLTIDDEGIKAGIDFAEYKQYDIEYLFISTQAEDKTALSEEDKKAAFDKISALYEKTLVTEDWSTLVPEGEEALTYTKDNFLASGTTFSDEFEAMMMAMSNNSVSEVYEAENGYYIVRMIDNNSSESYDAAVTKAITDVEYEGFSKVYSEILTKYDYKLNDKTLDNLIMGEITLAN